jgi:uncharacterized delta-60 repeat protein
VTARVAAVVASGAALWAGLAGPVAGAPGDLDPGFGSGGIVVVDEGVSEYAYGMTVQPDGKIIGVGTTQLEQDQDALVFRLNADGTRDATFGYRALGDGGDQYAADAAVQPDGKVVVVGQDNAIGDAVVWRLLSSGAPDPSFGGGDGVTTIDSGGFEWLDAVAIAPDGRIVVAGGTSLANQSTVYRLTTGGRPDPTFDDDGAVGIAGKSHITDVAVQPDGKVLATGYVAADHLDVLRLDVAGEADPTYGGGDGVASSALKGRGTAVALQSDGRVVVSGDTPGGDGSYDAVLVRYTASGQPDGGYGTGGAASFDVGGDEYLEDLALTPSGGAVASGETDAGEEPIVVKVDAQGRPDAAFGTNGAVLLPGTAEYGYSIGVQPDGHVVVTTDDAKASFSAVVYRLIGDYRAPAAQPQPQPTVTCHGRPATLVGTAGKDRLVGTTRADVVVALGGNDVVKGLGGNDVVCAGDGADKVSGGPGQDKLYGERGADRLAGGTGKDRIVGGPDRDITTQRS